MQSQTSGKISPTRRATSAWVDLAMVAHRLRAGERLPALDRDVDVGGGQLHGIADTPGLFGSDDGCARAREGLVEQGAGLRVVLDRAPDGLHRLAGRVLLGAVLD